jgi:hypothetical protein
VTAVVCLLWPVRICRSAGPPWVATRVRSGRQPVRRWAGGEGLRQRAGRQVISQEQQEREAREVAAQIPELLVCHERKRGA